MTRRFTAVLATAAVSAFACASPALGATPIVVGQGDKPDVAVDAAGTAHIAFSNSSPTPEEARYCRLPRGGSACVDAETFVGVQPGDSDSVTGRAHVFAPNAGEVIVAHERCCGEPEGMMSNRSLDGGLTFAPRSFFGEMPIGASFDEAVYGPGSSITALAEVVTAGTQVQNGPVAGPEQTLVADLSAINAEGAIGLDSAGRPVAVYQVQSSPNWLLNWRRLADGHALTSANINDAAKWTSEALIAGDRIDAADGPALAGGPAGLFLFFQRRLPDEGFVTKFTGSGWTAPVKITDNRPFNQHDLYQDAAGRLHAVWNAYTDQELRYTWSDDGVNWAPVVDIARGESFPHLRVAAAADHQGFAVWDRGGPDIMAVPLEALPEPASPGGPGGTTPDTTDPAVGGFAIGDRTLVSGAGTTFSFNSSEAGRATLSFHKRVKGLKVRQRGRRRCVPQTRARLRRLRRSAGSRAAYRRLLRQRRCKAWKKVGQIRRDVIAGRNEIVWNGRVAGRRLSPGLYQARLVIKDAAGNASSTERLRFRVRRRR
jgi:hypothetical protein